METTIVGMEQSRVMAFLNSFKEFRCVNIIDGLVVLSAGDTRKRGFLVLGDNTSTADNGISFDFNSFELTRYCRAAKNRAFISFEIRDTDGGLALVANCDALGEQVFVDTASGKSRDLFNEIGDCICTIPHSDVAKAASILNRCDPESGRYSLGCVCFDADVVVATDGRRLVTMETDAEYDGDQNTKLVSTEVIEFANKHGYDVDLFKPQSGSGTFMVAGELIVNIEYMRFPDWRQIMRKDTTESITVDVKSLVADCDKVIAKAKLDDEATDAVQIHAEGHGEILLNAKFVKDAVKGLKTVTISFNSDFAPDKAKTQPPCLTSPAVLSSTERDGWKEIIMPIAWNR